MRKTLPRVLLVLLVLLIGIQLVRPEQSNPASDPKLDVALATTAPPGERVMAILQRSCFDCHSNNARWPWYSQIAPFSWTIAHDVEEGREHLNFSTWGSYSAEDRSDLLRELCEEVEHGEMPPGNYLLLHGEADLSEAEHRILCEWARQERRSLGSGTGDQKERGRDDDRQK